MAAAAFRPSWEIGSTAGSPPGSSRGLPGGQDQHRRKIDHSDRSPGSSRGLPGARISSSLPAFLGDQRTAGRPPGSSRGLPGGQDQHRRKIDHPGRSPGSSRGLPGARISSSLPLLPGRSAGAFLGSAAAPKIFYTYHRRFSTLIPKIFYTYTEDFLHLSGLEALKNKDSSFSNYYNYQLLYNYILSAIRAFGPWTDEKKSVNELFSLHS